ncbi:MAG: phosphoribosylglycinamide formyltransferase [Actinobacteria bacterium]|nr:phosphoribosylglycinamide formyltransferase [Actinomycetota bacterium]
MADKKRLAVLASGFGSNLQAIIDQSQDLDINGEIVLVFSNNENAYALERAKKHGIKSASFNPGQFESRQQYDKELLALLKNEKIDLIVMAGYLLLMGPETIREFSNRIINIHPALLPSFKGIHSIKDAFDYGVKVTGVTVHFVEEELDAGPVISQEAVIITEDDTIETLEEKIHKIEHKIYPLAVKYFCNGRLAINGRKVEILKGE